MEEVKRNRIPKVKVPPRFPSFPSSLLAYVKILNDSIIKFNIMHKIFCYTLSFALSRANAIMPCGSCSLYGYTSILCRVRVTVSFETWRKTRGRIFSGWFLYKCIQLNSNENESLCVSALSLVHVCENAMSRHLHHTTYTHKVAAAKH